jgi:ketosteroid isomerase-like protein
VTQDNPNRPGPKPDPSDERKDHPTASPEVAAENQSEHDLSGHEFSGQDLGDFFQRFPGTFRWPKPDAQAVAAAVEAIQRMSGSVVASTTDDTDEAASVCSGCARSLPAGARFCVWCGIPIQPISGDAADPSQQAAGQHHFHHHYHHFVSGPGASGTESTVSAPRGRAPGPAGAASPGTGGRAEAGARQVVQDWAQACNTKHIDDLIELYSADATLIRSSIPPVRSLPAIREFLVSLLEAGLGDVEMESLRVEMMGEVAIDLGRCKLLVPVAMGKRREERGKYLIVLVRQPNGTWKILADCWSADLAPSASVHELPAARKAGEPIPPVRKPR